MNFYSRKKSKTKQEKLEEKKIEKEELEVPQVSKDRFYEVSDSLTQVFRDKQTTTSGETSFSLLSAFASRDDGDDQQEIEYTGKLLVNNTLAYNHDRFTS